MLLLDRCSRVHVDRNVGVLVKARGRDVQGGAGGSEHFSHDLNLALTSSHENNALGI